MPEIADLYAWIVTEADGGEGIAAALLPLEGGPTWMPLVGADLPRMVSLRQYAELIQGETGRPMRLVRFTLADDKLDVL